MFEHIFNIGILFNLILEFVCCYFTVGIFCKKRRYKHAILAPLVFTGMVIIDYVVVIALYYHVPVKMFFSFFIFTGCMCILYDDRITKVFIFASIFYGVIACSDVIYLYVINKIFLVDKLDFVSQPRDTVLLIICRLILLFIIFCVKLKSVKNTNRLMAKKDIFWCVAISEITIVLCAIIWVNFNAINNTYITIFMAGGMIAINFILFFIIENMMQKETDIQEARLLHEKTKNELNMYYSISENLDKQRKMSHEFKNHLSCINELAKLGNLDELKSYISKIDGEILERTDMVDTNNVIVNAIINTKYREALEKGIVFVLKVNDLSNLPLSDMDIVTVLSNLLNNAFEACEQCAEDKVIKLKFVVEKSYTIISVKNTMAKKPMQKDGIFETTKTIEAQEHGIGIKNVCDVLGKYDAKYRIDYDEEEFTFSVVI